MSNFNLMEVPEKTLFWDYSVGILNVSTKPCSGQSKRSFKKFCLKKQKPSICLIFFFYREDILLLFKIWNNNCITEDFSDGIEGLLLEVFLGPKIQTLQTQTDLQMDCPDPD